MMREGGRPFTGIVIALIIVGSATAIAGIWGLVALNVMIWLVLLGMWRLVRR